MRNWKTTLIGTALAVVTFLATYQSNGGKLDDWSLWVIPALLQGLGFLAKDAGVSGKQMAWLLPVLLCSCSSLTPERTRALADLGLVILESRGIMAPRDAADIRMVGNALIPLTSAKTVKEVTP